MISAPLLQRPPTGRRAGRSALSEELAGAGNVSTQAPPPSQAAGHAAAASAGRPRGSEAKDHPGGRAAERGGTAWEPRRAVTAPACA